MRSSSSRLTFSGNGSPLSTLRKYFWAWVRIWRTERVWRRPEITSQSFPNCLSPRRKSSCSVLDHRPLLSLSRVDCSMQQWHRLIVHDMRCVVTTFDQIDDDDDDDDATTNSKRF